MDLNPPMLAHWLDHDLVLRLGVAALLGLGLGLGLDRELRRHAAGLRTHGLICVSAAAMTVSIISLYNQLHGLRMDPLRLYEAAGALIGIIGAGQGPLVVICGIVSLIMLTVLRLIERKFFLDRDYT